MATSLEIVISGRNQFSGTANNVVNSLNRIQTAAGRVGRGVGQVAGGLGRLGFIAGGVAAAGLLASARAAISFEDAFAGVRKTADLSEAEFIQLAGSFRQMATEIPISANELARLGETAGALGITGVANIREFARVTALLGVTTNLTADAAAESLGHISTILGLTGKDYERFASALVDLGNKGASTEDQIAAIAERAAGGASTINLSTQALLGWSAAIANLGVEAEAGGTNFQKFLIESARFTAESGDELQTLAKVAGMTGKQWKKEFGTDPNSALSQFVVGLGKLNTEQRITALGILGWDDQRMARILLGLAANTGNLTDALSNSAAAWDKNSALSEEAQKRFDTVASKLAVLKNGFTEMALLVGEGFTPALGRAAEKLTAFLALDTTKSSLRAFGEDLGRALDDVNWQGVLDGAKTFVSLLGDALAILNALPSQIKLGGAALITAFNAPIIGPALGQVGKGVGNIGLGLLSGAGSLAGGKAGGALSLLAQPVRVVNWPVGFGTGAGVAGAAGKGGGLLGKVAILGTVALAGATILELKGMLDTQSAANAAQSAELGKQTKAFIAAPTTSRADLETSLAGLKAYREELRFGSKSLTAEGIAFALNIDHVSDTMKAQIKALETAIAAAPRFGGRSPDERDTSNAQRAAADRIYDSLERNRLAIASMPPPVVNVTVNVTARDMRNATTTHDRVGPSTGSAGRTSVRWGES